MKFLPYESIMYKVKRRNRSNERAIVAAGVCAFLSSYFANLATTDSFNFTMVLLAPIMVVLYLVLYWIYGKCSDAVIRSSKLGALVMGDFYREEVTHIIAEEIPTDLAKLLSSLCNSKEECPLLKVKALYEIENMLDFLENYLGSVYINSVSTQRKNRPSPAFISIVTITAIANGISEVLNKCKNQSENEIVMFCERLTNKKDTVFKRYLKGENKH